MTQSSIATARQRPSLELSSLALGLVLVAGLVSPTAAQQARTAHIVRPGDAINDTLRAADQHLIRGGPFHVFRLQADTNRLYVITVRSTPLDPILAVAAAVGGITQLLQSDDDSGGGKDALIRFVPPQNGEYLLIVAAADSNTGPFTLRVDQIDIKPPRVSTIAMNDSVTGALSLGAGVDRSTGDFTELLAFHAHAGHPVQFKSSPDSVDLLVGRLTSSSKFQQFADSEFNKLEQGVSTKVDRDAESLVRYPRSRGWFISDHDADYVLRVTPAARGGIARYVVTMNDDTLEARGASTLSDSVGLVPQTLIADQEVTGELPWSSRYGRTYQQWVYAAHRGERLTVTTTSDFLSRYVGMGRFRDGRFVELAHNDDSALPAADASVATVSMIAPEDGDIIIRAGGEHFNKDDGQYKLRLLARMPVVHHLRNTELTVGKTVQDSLVDRDATLDDGSRYREWTFRADKSGEAFTLLLQSKDFDTFLSVGQQQGGRYVEFSVNDDASDDKRDGVRSSRLEIVAPHAGTFIVRVNTFGPDQLGVYTLLIDRMRK